MTLDSKPLVTRVYEIINVLQNNHVELHKNDLVGHTTVYASDLDEKSLLWMVTMLGNGRYRIQNRAHPTRFVVCENPQPNGKIIVAPYLQQWVIKSTGKQEGDELQYVIEHSRGGSLFWALVDWELGTPVTLLKVPTNPKANWRFVLSDKPPKDPSYLRKTLVQWKNAVHTPTRSLFESFLAGEEKPDFLPPVTTSKQMALKVEDSPQSPQNGHVSAKRETESISLIPRHSNDAGPSTSHSSRKTLQTPSSTTGEQPIVETKDATEKDRPIANISLAISRLFRRRPSRDRHDTRPAS
ncbi:hypothetical protein BD410DRAFT_794271 [Rickenella mellea]|uniref:Uncharacterized protein n=1 Tax=Rickenella mellea TaxID=50990 RepID=A0A4Y7PSA7_9AGAM|nr:hypothetical protein BD410DRAFT_794271 [Rickenella mellea]